MTRVNPGLYRMGYDPGWLHVWDYDSLDSFEISMQKLSLLYNRLLLTASTDRKYTNTPFGFKWWDELKLLFRSFRSSSGKAHIFNRFISIFSLWQWITSLQFHFKLKIFHLFVVEKSLLNQCCIFEKRLFWMLEHELKAWNMFEWFVEQALFLFWSKF